MALKLYNALTKKIEEFAPREDKRVGMYTCGPTVYDYPHVGNWRTFVFADILRRVLKSGGYEVTQVMNATDVGHLTGDNLGNADLGEDRMEEAAKREGKTAWEIADYYISDFIAGREQLNILPPAYFVRATDHISEQIRLIGRLIDKGLAYVTATGVFFDVLKFPDYGQLGGQKLIDKRAVTREELVDDKTKHNPADFALWKFSYLEGRSFDFAQDNSASRRQMEWDSPWGQGFPGWHIECSAMAMKYLGESFDIHTGGVDHVAIHHTNEIAQSEGATGKPLAKYWLHGEFLTVDGGRMGKSLGNAYTLHDIIKKGFDPLALRYFYLSAHYRTVLNFTWEALDGAQNGLDRLRSKVGALRQSVQEVVLHKAVGGAGYERKFLQKFLETINDDLNMPQALAVVWQMTEDKNLPERAILASLLRFDQVLGLKLGEISPINRIGLIDQTELPSEVQQLIGDREKLRQEKKFAEADKVREKVEKLGYKIEDNSEGMKVKKLMV